MRDDPLEAWLLCPRDAGSIQSAGSSPSILLDELESLLRAPEGKPPRDFTPLRIGRWANAPTVLPAKERARAEALYGEVFESSGSGKHRVEEALLWAIGFSAESASIPFFRRHFSLTKPRDTFAATRRRLAAAGLAHVAIRSGDQAAIDSLHTLAEQGSPDERTEAVAALGAVVLRPGGPNHPSTIVLLERVAQNDAAFAPRFIARGILVTHGVGLPAVPKGEIVTIEASLGKVSRTIELRATSSLGDLAGAILDAFQFDGDHLFAFYMTGDIDDHRFELNPFDGAEMQGAFGTFDFGPARPEEDAGGGVADLQLGQLGLVAGHRFLFRFDFGDDNRFALVVKECGARAQRGVKYPRVSEAKGQAPEQYPR